VGVRAGLSLKRMNKKKPKKILREIHGLTTEKDGWGIIYKYEIVKTVKLGRLGWLGHLTGANETSSCRKLTFSKPESTMKAGRPGLGWLDSVEKDLRILGLRGWKTKALNRNLWRRTMEKAKTHTGL
jgi:hypothetical protein